jgi:hypothetical protein
MEVELPLAYVYGLWVEGVLRYIGKGRNGRENEHVRIAKSLIKCRNRGEKPKSTYFYNKLAHAVKTGAKIETHIIVAGLFDEEAYTQEVAFIAVVRHSGQLWNLDPGGRGLRSETVKKLWQDPVSRANYLAAAKSPERSEASCQAALESWKDPEVRAARNMRTYSPEFSKIHSEKAKAQHACGNLGSACLQKEEVLVKLRAAAAKRNAYTSPETRKKISVGVSRGHALRRQAKIFELAFALA